MNLYRFDPSIINGQKMTNSFWALCDAALVAFRHNKPEEAMSLLEAAKEKISNGELNEVFLAKRHRHLKELLSHRQKKTPLPVKIRHAVGSNDPINVLYVLPDLIDSSYGYNVLNLVKMLATQNVNCVIAIPKTDGASAYASTLSVKSFADIKNHGTGFPNGRNPDIIHAWTAQEIVRVFCDEVQKKYPTELIIQIQNNEEYLTEKILGMTWEELQAIPVGGIKKEQGDNFFHPLNGPAWLKKADGFTLAIDSLKRFNFAGVPSALLPPLIDENLFYPRPVNKTLRNKLGIPKEHIVIVFHGTVRAANQEEIRQLYQAVESLNQQGNPTTLIRIGKNRDPRVISTWPSTHVKGLGWIARNDLPDIMAAADFFVQPGSPGAYNDQRAPTKLLEYFALGRPVILPRTNLGLQAIHRQDAYIMENGVAGEIVMAILEIKEHQKLCTTLTNGAVNFYLKYAEHEHCQEVCKLYRTILSEDSKEIKKKSQQVKDAVYDQAMTTSQVIDYGEIKKLQDKIKRLEHEKIELSECLRSMPSIDPLCVRDPTYAWPVQDKEDFGIIVFGHTRLDSLGAVLESLRRQDALKYTEVWLDGFQGNQNLKHKIENTIELVKKYPVKHLNRQSGNFGFRKMLILGLVEMCKKYKDILIFEDDCFPTHDAVSEFRKELDLIRENNSIFSVYGHHFLVESEKETCARFQGWGWATTSEKLMPMLRQLIDCYSMTEERYLKFVKLALTSDIKARIDVMHPRQPSFTLEKFFAWDETLCLLTALNNQVHKPTKKRTVYNCGMGSGSTHFDDNEMWRNPPFNLITAEEVWKYF